jgi:Ankyrin repeats (3 copies)
MHYNRETLYETAEHYGRTDCLAVLEPYRPVSVEQSIAFAKQVRADQQRRSEEECRAQNARWLAAQERAQTERQTAKNEMLLIEHEAAVALAHAAAANSCSSKQMLSAIGRGDTDAVQQLLYSSDCRGKLVDTREHTALHAAAAVGSLHCAALLLRCKLDVHARSSDGHTALDIALCRGLSAELRGVCTGSCNSSVSAADQQAVALLLLHCGAQLSAHTEQVDGSVLAAVAAKFVSTLQQQLKLQSALLAVYATAAFAPSSSTSMTALKPAAAKLQVTSSSAQQHSRVFTFDTAVLAKLLAVHAEDSQDVLMNLVLPERWLNAAATQRTGSNGVVHSTCSGRHSASLFIDQCSQCSR